jgi:hypothetical protein
VCDLAHGNCMNLFNLVRRSDCAACKIDEIVDVAPLRSRKSHVQQGHKLAQRPEQGQGLLSPLGSKVVNRYLFPCSTVSNRYHRRGAGSDVDDGAILSSEIRSAVQTRKFANTA